MKKINKLFATIISGTLLFSSVGTTAFAEESTTNETPFYTYTEIQNMPEEKFLTIGDNQTLYNSILYFIDHHRYISANPFVDSILEIKPQLNGISIPKECFLEDKIYIVKPDDYDKGYIGEAEYVLKPEYVERFKKFEPSKPYFDTYMPILYSFVVNSKGQRLDNDYEPEIPLDKSTISITSNGFKRYDNSKVEALEAAKTLFGYAQVFGEAYITEITLSYGGESINIDQMLCGDINMDKKIGLRDALALNRLIVQAAQGIEFNKCQKTALDCYNDGKIDTVDSVILLQYLVGMHKTLPVNPE